MNKVLVVSPHLDDAVFSAGEFLAGRQGVVVVTMLAGTPDPPVRTQWDTKRCGFSTSQDAVQRRRAEDEAAMAVLKATPIHLDFLDGQYKPSDIGELANALSELVEHHQPEFVAGPLGVHHDDHVRVREAVLTANLPVPVWLYADLPYFFRYPLDAAVAYDAIEGFGCTLEPVSIGEGSRASKIKALACYSSQIRNRDIEELLVREQFWRVNRSP
jgi:LmbE family N-acetylglucosaminyl deacetylase